MLAPSKYPDFHHVPESHKAVDARLENWARFVQVKYPSWVSPIWKLGKSNGRQWHAPEFRPECDLLDGQKMEIAVRSISTLERAAVRWAYVYRGGEINFRRKHHITREKLAQLLHDGRQMLTRI